MSAITEPEKKTQLNQLEQLRRFTMVVADTGDFESIRNSSRAMRPRTRA